MILQRSKETIGKVRKAIQQGRLMFACWNMDGKDCSFILNPGPDEPDNVAAVEYCLTLRESIGVLKGMWFHVVLMKGGAQQ